MAHKHPTIAELLEALMKVDRNAGKFLKEWDTEITTVLLREECENDYERHTYKEKE